MTPEERRKRMEERLASMSPEERERFEARMRERMAQGGQAFGGRSGEAADSVRRDPSRGITAGITAGATHQSGATTIDALFGPLPTVETRGRTWLYIDKKLKPVSLRLGVSDGTYTEVLSGDLQPNQEVVINMVTGLEPQRPATTGGGQNPLMGPQRGGRGR